MARPRSTFLSLATLIGFSLASPSCQEHRRLEAETAAAKKQVGELRPQVQNNLDEAAQYSRTRTELLNAHANDDQAAFTPNGSKALEDEMAALQAEKSRLEKDIKAIDEEHEQYKKTISQG
ncbi:hypothetical protein [Roseimicrobium sp. ORNL1]|uniref:hypothetical protein n=1 Tax=Roseimicrobium sp. ORNL1 TaxID=2711231 RepID=UPI0013E16F52|nr:hypothetical protein [Roseimicrobium sp. ORNL1]QIF02495.1 hypothetical protein G5S37_13480 [Roseimicrobium sp. ORNL1]